jgi:hypothetical protein
MAGDAAAPAPLALIHNISRRCLLGSNVSARDPAGSASNIAGYALTGEVRLCRPQGMDDQADRSDLESVTNDGDGTERGIEVIDPSPAICEYASPSQRPSNRHWFRASARSQSRARSSNPNAHCSFHVHRAHQGCSGRVARSNTPSALKTGRTSQMIGEIRGDDLYIDPTTILVGECRGCPRSRSPQLSPVRAG